MNCKAITADLPSGTARNPEAASSALYDHGLCPCTQVQVKRRETERQVEMRVNSYAYLQGIEADEPWLELDAHAPDSGAAQSVWSALHRTFDADVPMSLSREAYLDALLPGEGPRCALCFYQVPWLRAW